ncbi:hypothetical protein GJ744_005319 [Endocarpon pusillum]|uniref:DUF7924 domain-containing protein n=1 Tax=Endocarpon pusillum TaxID=364733 RepID=A0A8H7AL10_9EURO|nr:hypothetical protein GJ744_005319 [Endocarpon pusillum]
MLFPFFTAEVKCGKEGLDVADRANTNSMTIALRAVVELYRQAGEVTKVHRETLGFSISHNDGSVRIYGHYPEINGDTTTYHRTAIREFSYADNNAQERDTTYRFVWNVFTIFAPAHLKRLKEVIGCLRDPLSPAANARTPDQTPTTSGDNAVPVTPVKSNPGMFAKPGPPQRHNSATVSQQVEQQRREIMAQFDQLQKTSRQQLQEAKEREDKLQKEAKEREDKLQKEAKEREDKLQKEAKEREDKLLAQLEQLQMTSRQQQQEAKEREDKLMVQLQQQQKEMREQHTQLMKMLTQKMAPAQDTEKM